MEVTVLSISGEVNHRAPPTAADPATSDPLDSSGSSVGSTDSYDEEDARRFLHEWKRMWDLYSEATKENGQL